MENLGSVGEVRDDTRPACVPTWNEAERLAALDRYAILDTGREAAFDQLAELAADILDAPIAVVNFIAADRQWFKAEKGIGKDTLPLDVSICRWAILQPGVFVVPDLTKDPRFEHNPLVDAVDGLRFYAGALLETPDGLPLGTICVLDTQARPEGVTERQARALTALASQTMAQLELRRTSSAARRESQRLAAMFAQATVGMSEMGLDGRFLLVNDRLCDILGRSRDALLELGIADVTHPLDLADTLPRFVRMVENGESFNLDMRYLRPDGTIVWANSSVVQLVDEQGRPRAAFAVTTDITARREEAVERARAENALKESEERLRLAVENADVGFWDLDMVNDLLIWPPRTKAMFGISAHLPVSMADFYGGLHPEDRAATTEAFAAATDPERRALYDIEYRTVGKEDGVIRWVAAKGRGLFDQSGRCVRVAGTAIDITARKATEAALAVSEERARMAVEGAKLGAWDWDIESGRGWWSARTTEMMGVESGEAVTSEGRARLIHPDDRDRVREAVAAAVANGVETSLDYRIVRPNGEVRWLMSRGTVSRGPGGRATRVTGIVQDITDERLAVRRVGESEARFRLIADSAPVPMWVTRIDRKREFVNRAYVDFLGATYDEATDFDWRTILHPEDAPRIYQEQVAKEAALQPFTLEARYRNATGQYRWLRSESQPRWGPDGEHVGFIGVAYDITMAKEAQIELQARVAEAAADLDRAWRNASDIFVVIDGDGVLRRANPATTAILGWTQDEMVGRSALHFVHPEDLEATTRALAFAQAGKALPKFENRYRAKDGGLRTIAWLAASEGALTYGYGRDVTAETAREAELETAREALRQSQKMEAMGQLTGGVAHDFNNLLTPIVAGLDMLQRKGLGGEREQRLIAGAAQSAERAKTLVQRLLAFARRQPLQAVPVDVGKLVAGMGDLVSSTTGPQIKVVVDASEALPPAKADANQLEMALLNLAVNARDAMPDGGTLRISASVEAISGAHRSGLKPGAFVRLSVADTGKGMDEATLARSVEPFFSTKGVGKGTGLGLSMVHGLVSQLGGAVTIRSRPGLGTNVELWLPVSSTAPVDTPSPPVTMTASAPLGTALLVDDEDLVRMSTADMLIDLGYEVLEARSGEEAMKLVEDGAPFDLLVTDHLMPGMTGVDLAYAVRTARPGVPVLLVSGYAEHQGIDPGLPRLTKPYRKDDLAASLAELASTVR